MKPPIVKILFFVIYKFFYIQNDTWIIAPLLKMIYLFNFVVKFAYVAYIWKENFT